MPDGGAPSQAMSQPDFSPYLPLSATPPSRPGPSGTTQVVQFYSAPVACFLSALDKQLLTAVRSHWSIENSLHWTLDVTFREDQCRVRKDHGPQNLATLRQIGHNLLKNERTLKVGIQGKRLNAGWDEDYLLRVLLG